MKKYSGKYNKEHFYSVMGKFFAEPEYKRLMPYLSNRENDEWIIIEKEGDVVAFSSYTQTKAGTNIKSCYYQKLPDARKIIKRIIKEASGQAYTTIIMKENQKLIQLLIKEFGFRQTKVTKNYIYLKKEELENDN